MDGSRYTIDLSVLAKKGYQRKLLPLTALGINLQRDVLQQMRYNLLHNHPHFPALTQYFN